MNGDHVGLTGLDADRVAEVPEALTAAALAEQESHLKARSAGRLALATVS